MTDTDNEDYVPAMSQRAAEAMADMMLADAIARGKLPPEAAALLPGRGFVDEDEYIAIYDDGLDMDDDEQSHSAHPGVS